VDQEELQIHRGARPVHLGQAFSNEKALYRDFTYVVTLRTEYA